MPGGLKFGGDFALSMTEGNISLTGKREAEARFGPKSLFLPKKKWDVYRKGRAQIATGMEPPPSDPKLKVYIVCFSLAAVVLFIGLAVIAVYAPVFFGSLVLALVIGAGGPLLYRFSKKAKFLELIHKAHHEHYVGSYSLAVDALRQARILNPKNKLCQALLGILLAKKGELEQARPYVETGVKAFPNDTILRMLLAASYESEGKLKEAAHVLRSIGIHKSESPFAQAYLAGVTARLGNDREALETARELLHSRRTKGLPTLHVLARALLVIIYERGKDLSSAIDQCKKLISLESNFDGFEGGITAKQKRQQLEAALTGTPGE